MKHKLIMENWKRFLTETETEQIEDKKKKIADYKEIIKELIPKIKVLKKRCQDVRNDPTLEPASFEKTQCGDLKTPLQYRKLSGEYSHCLSQYTFPSPSGRPECRDFKLSLTNLQQMIVKREHYMEQIQKLEREIKGWKVHSPHWDPSDPFDPT